MDVLALVAAAAGAATLGAAVLTLALVLVVGVAPVRYGLALVGVDHGWSAAGAVAGLCAALTRALFAGGPHGAHALHQARARR